MLLRLFQGFPAPESSSEDAAAEENGAAVPDIFRYTPCNDSAGSMHMQRKTGIVPEGFPGMPAAGQRRIGVRLYAACWVGYNHPCSLFFMFSGRSESLHWRYSPQAQCRWGVIPRPTVKVRMKENMSEGGCVKALTCDTEA